MTHWNEGESRKTILIDMDGVMADFDGGALKSLPEELWIPKNAFYITDVYPPELSQTIKETYSKPRFFEELEPMPSLLEGWQALLDNGYYPQVASAPLSSNKTAIEGKIKWLDRHLVPHFGAGVVEDAIIDKAKYKYPGLALIDDRPSVPRGPEGTDVAEWEHILFGWAHLSKVPLATAAFRMLDWDDVHGMGGLLETLEIIERRQ